MPLRALRGSMRSAATAQRRTPRVRGANIPEVFTIHPVLVSFTINSASRGRSMSVRTVRGGPPGLLAHRWGATRRARRTRRALCRIGVRRDRGRLAVKVFLRLRHGQPSPHALGKARRLDDTTLDEARVIKGGWDVVRINPIAPLTGFLCECQGQS